MNVANASLSQMPFHHGMVTRSPNHMWATSWATTSATRSISVCEAAASSTRSAVSRKVTRRGSPWPPRRSPGWRGGRACRRDTASRSTARRTRARTRRCAGHARQVGLAGHAPDAERRLADHHRRRRLELADDEGDEVRRHADACPRSVTALRPGPAGDSLDHGRVGDRGQALGHDERHAEDRLRRRLVPARERAPRVGRLELGGGDRVRRPRRRPCRCCGRSRGGDRSGFP